MRRLLPALALLAVAAPAAAAQVPPQPAKLALRLNLVGHTGHPVVFVRHAWRVRGNLVPYVPGQKVRVRFWRYGKLFAEKTVHVLKPSFGTAGKFVVSYHTRFPGRIRAVVVHEATPQQAYARLHAPPVDVIGDTAAYGQHSRTVRVMQRLLRADGYVPGSSGTFDQRTAFAVLAFRKMTDMPRVATFASQAMLQRLIDGRGRFAVRFPSQGRHAEADLGHQVLALVDGARVDRLYPISSGKPSTPTILGTFRIYSRVPGYLPDGMYYSSFFIRGYAIHGYDPSPVYPASHGCLRTQIAQAIEIYDWLALGDYVDTYYRSGIHTQPPASAYGAP